jgi:hypothetical protein
MDMFKGLRVNFIQNQKQGFIYLGARARSIISGVPEPQEQLPGTMLKNTGNTLLHSVKCTDTPSHMPHPQFIAVPSRRMEFVCQ